MGDMLRIPAFILAALLGASQLAGCARTAPPAPVEVKGQESYGRATMAAAPVSSAPTHPGAVTVQRGDTLYGIARQHNIPTRAIIDANRLQAPYALRVGQRLTLPQVRTHQVQSGDTLAAVSRRYGVEMSSLVRTNKIEAPYHLMAGQTLILPGGAAVAPTREPAPALASASASEIQIARASDPSPDAAPPAVPATAVESTSLPAPTAAANPTIAAAPPVSAPVAAAPPVRAVAPEPTPAPAVPYVAAPPPPAPRPAPQVAEIEPAAVTLPARAGRGFQWPVRGRVISDYGPKGGGLQNDGINIAAAHGAPIRAAEHGVVVYAGNELRGFGNLLLVRHADGWMTAYGHADEILVARGDQVRRGQVVARVGSTGNVTTPQVHFEIRRGSRAVNPREHLTSETASSE
jgi:murein DD-endopeptidase MepM/ murein hydrolase activator NlpD